MHKKVKQKQLISISFYVNLATWVAWLSTLSHYRSWQLPQFFDYSMLVFAAGIAYKLLSGNRSLARDCSEIEWPLAVLILHLIPLANLVVYAVYFFLGGAGAVGWNLMFVAPLLSGIGLVNRLYLYNHR